MPTRETILAAAEQVIRRHGLAQATTRRIAELARCSEGSIYNHFTSKQDLVAQVVGDRLSDFPSRAKAMAELAGDATVEANLLRLARQAIAFFHKVVPMIGVMMSEPSAMPERFQTVDRAGHGPRWVLRGVVEYLRREQQLGRIRPDADVEGAAMCLIGGCFQQAMVTHALGPEAVLLGDDDAAVQVAGAIAKGLEPTRGPTPVKE
ncbi:MAG: TetR/AcrR family transcriptional regulator [Euzebyales bacterium]|nr:TetR/AcrR family transcriptional regulator [Euzebyales bacterium]